MMPRLSNHTLIVASFVAFSIPVAPEARFILFDIFAILICISHSRLLAHSNQVKIIVLFFLCYQAVMLVSTVAHGLPITNFVRRSYAVTFLLIEALALYRLLAISNERRLLALILGVMLGVCMHYFYPSDDRIYDLPLKFLLGIPIGVILVVTVNIVSYRQTSGKLMLSIVVFAYSLFLMLAGSRANGGFFFVAALLVWLKFDILSNQEYGKKFLAILPLGLIGVYLLSELYTYATIKGIFGETAQGIAIFQSSFGNILLGGRPEIIVNVTAFLDSPLIGHGPIAEDSQYLNILSVMNVYSDEYLSDNPEKMYHSVLFTSLQEGGMMASLIWIYVIYKMTYAIPIIISLQRKLAFMVVPLLLAGIWHTLFSPLISYNRWFIALAIGMAFFCCDRIANYHSPSKGLSLLKGKNRTPRLMERHG